MKTTLHALTDDLQRLDALLDELEGDPTAETAQLIDAVLASRDETQEAIAAKLDNYCRLIQSRQKWVEIRQQEAERLAQLAEADAKLVGFLKSRLKAHLEASGKRKIRTTLFNITLATNGGKQPLRLTCHSPHDLPERFQRVAVEPDMSAIREAIATGEDLPFVEFLERGSHVRIR